MFHVPFLRCTCHQVGRAARYTCFMRLNIETLSNAAIDCVDFVWIFCPKLWYFDLAETEQKPRFIHIYLCITAYYAGLNETGRGQSGMPGAGRLKQKNQQYLSWGTPNKCS